MRRLFFLVFPVLLVSVRPAVAQDSWAGKLVFTKTSGSELSFTETGDVVKLKYIYYRATDDKDGWIQIRQLDIGGWVQKSECVPLDNAVEFFTTKIRANANDLSAYIRRGIAYRLNGKLDEALSDHDRALRLSPRNPGLLNNRGIVYVARKEFDKALDDYNEVIKLRPTFGSAYTARGNLWVKKKEFSKAIADFDKLIELEPKNYRGHNSRAWLLATCPDAKFRDGKKALASAKTACELSKWKLAYVVDTLAAAYAERGDFENAVKYQTQALEDISLAKDEDAQERLKLYKNKKPYRQK